MTNDATWRGNVHLPATRRRRRRQLDGVRTPDDRADPSAVQTTVEFFGPFAGGHVPFGLVPDEFTAYAQDKGLRRIGTIGSARHRPVAELDLDDAPSSWRRRSRPRTS